MPSLFAYLVLNDLRTLNDYKKDICPLLRLTGITHNSEDLMQVFTLERVLKFPENSYFSRGFFLHFRVQLFVIL